MNKISIRFFNNREVRAIWDWNMPNTKAARFVELITLFLILPSAHSAYAQDAERVITLGEVTVKAAKVLNKPDGMTIFPTEAQKKNSSNGYSFLEKLMLPKLRIDNIGHSVTAIDNRGSVQLRVNGIIVDKPEMIALDPNSITKVDFIDNPGLRYGEGIAYVINIVTRRADSGYAVGADITTSLTTLNADGTVYGKWNKGRSEWSASYGANGSRTSGERNTETADYTLTDGNLHTIERNDVEALDKNVGHNAKLTYNWADSTATVVQVALSGTLNRLPGSYRIKEITDGAQSYKATSRDDSRSSSPVLDLYFFRQFTPKQSITANAVGTYISTQTGNFYDEGTPYKYEVDGRSASFLSEVIYENRLKPFTFSAGLNYKYKHTKNEYCGDASSLTATDNNTLYAFGEIKGAIQRLQYTLGMGASYIHYTQNEHKYNFFTLRPKLSVAYGFNNGMQLSYSCEMRERASRIAMTSDATIRINSMEWMVGNPDLKPSRDFEQRLDWMYNTSRLQTFVEGYYKRCHKPNMAHYECTADNRFIYTQTNQKEIDVLNVRAYAGYWILPEKLHIAAQGGLSRCFNFAYDYTHCYTSWYYVGSISAYLGNFTLRGYIDNGNRFMEGETKSVSGSYAALKVSYRWKGWQFALTWKNPFVNNAKVYESELLNCNLYKHSVGYSKANGNCIALNIAWRLSRGSRHSAAEKRINMRDTDNGILKR